MEGILSEKMLEKLAEQFGLALDFSKENVIPYLQQLAERVVRYETGTSIAWLIVGLILLVGGLILIILAIKNADEWGTDVLAGLLIVGIVMCIFGLPMIFQQVEDLIACRYLPEKILLRYAK